MEYNIHYAIAALLFLIVYFAFIRIQYNAKDYRRFLMMIIVVFIADIFDIITAFSISYCHIVPIWLNNTLNTFYYIFSVLSAYCFPNYIRAIIYDKEYKLLDKFNLGLLIGFFFICLINLSTGVLFSFTEEEGYIHGPFYYHVYIITVYFMVCSFFRMIYCRSKFTKKQLYAILSFVAFSQVGTFIQVIFFSNVLLTFFTPALSAVIILIAFETPDYQLLIQTTEDLEVSKTELESAREREKERTRILHEIMRTASWELFFDDDGNLISSTWSPEFKRMLGYPSDTEISDSELWVKSLHPDDKNNAINAFYNGMTPGQEYRNEFRLIDSEGISRWYVGTGECEYNSSNHLVSYKGIIQDIDVEKNNLKLVQDRLSALEELEKSQEALKQALIEAESANKAKSTFLTNMSHDIRTPMNAIIGFTELALENQDDLGQITDCLDKIKTAGNHLISLINDILDMNRIESGKVSLELKPINLYDNLKDVYAIVQSSLEAGKLEYIEKFDNLEHRNVLCDGLRLNQILLNCIGNSIKFTPKGGKITVEVSEKKNDDNNAVYTFRISDTGIGMKAEFLNKIFEPFERERTSTISKTQGTGLGMSITKALIDMMNGTIRIESTEGVGTTYIFDLPLEIVNDTTQDPNENISDDISIDEMLNAIGNLHCLIVDDNSVNRLLAKKLLNVRSITTEEASDGQAAVDIIANAKHNYYDFILMDIQMPVMNGYEASDAIRALKDKALASIPIIAVTADAFDDDKNRCLEHGMNYHISKPIIVEELIKAIYAVIVKKEH